jgi:uncharacterized protein (DUF736 family)
MKLIQIGAGWQKTGKSGVPYVALSLDSRAIRSIADHDLRKVCLFKNKYKRNDQDPDYTVMAPGPEDQPGSEETKSADTPHQNSKGDMLPF